MPPTLGQVKESFPLPGRYHFRFKSPLVPGGDREKGGMAVWMDCVHDSQAIPTWRNSIIAKVSRVAVEEDDDDDDDFPSAAPSVPQQRQNAPPPPRHTESSEPLLDVFDGGHSSASAPSSHHSSTADLLNSAPPVPAAPTSGGSLLDMDGPHYSNHANQQQSSNVHHFMGMTSQPPATPSQPPNAPGYGQQQHQQPTPHQQQPAQQQPRPSQQAPQQARSGNAFDSFSVNKGKDDDPFGGMSWT